MPQPRLLRVLTSAVAVGATIMVTFSSATAASISQKRVPRTGQPAVHGPASAPADDRLLVTVDPGTTDAEAASIAARAGATLETRLADTLVLDPTGGATNQLSALSVTNGVRTVEPNLIIRGFAPSNDPLLADQYGLLDSQPSGTRTQSAWNNTRGSRDVVVGVLDSGIALNHPDLAANLWTNRTGINGCGYGTRGWNAVTANPAQACVPDDDGGHGTHVAGIVGATGNNGLGVSGVAQKVSLMGLKMLDGGGTGNVVDAIEAIDWALAAKASGVNLRVLQASWGSPVSSAALSAAIARANAAGTLFVTAAGNGICTEYSLVGLCVDPRGGVGQNLDSSYPGWGDNNMYPCEDPNPNVLCVAASTQSGTRAGFSNYGAATVDLAAPGHQIVSTVPRGLVEGCGFNAEYCAFDGTSMAAPMVGGAAVVVLAAEPDLSVVDLKARILNSVEPLPSFTGLVLTSGRLDVCRAIPNCDGRPAVPPTKPTSVRARAKDASVVLSWAAPDSNGNSFIVSGYDVEGPNGTTTFDFNTMSFTLTGLTNNENATIRIRSFGTGGIGPWVTKVVRPHVGGYEVDLFGAIHRVGVSGQLPSAASGGPYFPTGLARGIALVPEGTGGYVVDAFGGLHRFRVGATSPLPPVATGGPYWLGWGIVRGVTVSAKGGGYVLDGYGGVHRFGFGAEAPPTKTAAGPYWSGFDIARGLTLNDNGTAGYLVDGYGGLHRFRVGAAPLPPVPTGGPYWPGWNIVRGVSLIPGVGGGFVLDAYGGQHPFAAGGTQPAVPTSTPYWPGQDIARGVSF